MRTRWHLPILAAAALLVGLAAGSGTLALWNAQADIPDATITAGNLDIEADGAPVWTETSADVDAANGDAWNDFHEIDPNTFLVRQGDTFTVTQDFTTELQGDNMLGKVTVDWPTTPSLPGGVSGTYMVLDSGDNELLGSWTTLGTSASLTDDLDTDDAGRTDSFTLAIKLDFAGMADRFGSGSPVQTADLGSFTITLDQIREGDGF